MQENRQSHNPGTAGFRSDSGDPGLREQKNNPATGGNTVSDMLGGVLDDMPTTAKPHERTEGTVARMIEAQTSKLPSDTFLWGAVGAMGASAVCELAGWNSKSRFFGQWVAPLLLFGVYNKLVKLHGHDQLH